MFRYIASSAYLDLITSTSPSLASTIIESKFMSGGGNHYWREWTHIPNWLNLSLIIKQNFTLLRVPKLLFDIFTLTVCMVPITSLLSIISPWSWNKHWKNHHTHYNEPNNYCIFGNSGIFFLMLGNLTPIPVSHLPIISLYNVILSYFLNSITVRIN